jgi:2-polyprenyl-3-methyl-5-hydroxy-6-metoxy-1,4-benzoquinol methylase
VDTEKTKMVLHVFNTHAKLYQEKYMSVELYANSLNFFCDLIYDNAEVLEIACGPGNITRYLLDKKPTLKILGTDIADNMLELARANNPEAEFKQKDCREINSLDKKYDAIMCGFCLPYLSKEEAKQLIADAADLLKPNGVLYLSTMEDDYSKSTLTAGSTSDKLFMYYHEALYLNEFLKDSSFETIYEDRKVYEGAQGYKTTDLILISQLVK